MSVDDLCRAAAQTIRSGGPSSATAAVVLGLLAGDARPSIATDDAIDLALALIMRDLPDRRDLLLRLAGEELQSDPALLLDPEIQAALNARAG